MSTTNTPHFREPGQSDTEAAPFGDLIDHKFPGDGLEVVSDAELARANAFIEEIAAEGHFTGRDADPIKNTHTTAKGGSLQTNRSYIRAQLRRRFRRAHLPGV